MIVTTVKTIEVFLEQERSSEGFRSPFCISQQDYNHER